MATAAPPAPQDNAARNVSAGSTPTPGRLSDPYLWHKLHSFTGIFPIGVFLVQHLIANSYALRGPKAYNTVITVYDNLPFVTVLEVAVIYLPILYHSIYGFWITAYANPNVVRYGYGRNWMYLMQRVSGVIAFFYIGYHIYSTSIQKYIHGVHSIQYASMSAQFADPTHFVVQFIGIVATVFHFTNGLWNFCIRWGITISARSQRLNSYLCWGMFAVFTLIGLATLIHLHNDGLRHIATAVPAASAATRQSR